MRHLKLVDLLSEIGKKYGKSAGEVAIAWTLHHPAVTGAIVGGRRPEQVERNIGAAIFHLDQCDVDSIEAFVRANP